jgi:hypothetical protein
MTRIDYLICAILQSGIIQPKTEKLLLRVFGNESPKKFSLADYEAIQCAHDTEIASRAVGIAEEIERKIADMELRQMMQSQDIGA